jgi:predicted transposase YbfD/YdcC
MPKRKTGDKEYQELINVDLPALKESVQKFFPDFPDPRIQSKCLYPAWYLILIILCGYLSNCNTIADISYFVEVRGLWLNSSLGLNFKIPSYDTIWWFLVRVKPQGFKDLMSQWLISLPPDLKDQLLIVDGKRLKGVSNNEHISHFVELFAAESRLVIRQERVPDKSCERKALPQLLGNIDVRGAIISFDAHFTYKNDLQYILDQGADYLVGIKGNQGKLEAEVINFFNQAHAINYQSEEFKCYSTLDKGHGRIESRRFCVSQDLDWLPQKDEWGLQSLIEVRSERVLGDKIENSVRYYGSSRLGSAEQFGHWIRKHWEIENPLHYVVDVIFKEDASLANTGYIAENMSLFRRLTMNVVRTFDPKRGMADARRGATYDPNYLLGLLSRLFMGKC